MRVEAEILTVHTADTFAIAHGASDAFERVILTVEADGVTGRGESAPVSYYSGTAGGDLKALKAVDIPDPWDIEGTLAANPELSASARCALDCALHDLAARRLGIPLYRLLGLPRSRTVTAYTLPIADERTTLRRAKNLTYPILKMKVGSAEDLKTVAAVSRVTDAELWVDANEAFTLDEAVEVAGELRGMGVRLIEQPVAAADGPGAMAEVMRAAAPVPVIADESAHTAADVARLAGCVSGVNVKLAKCGGVRGALAMIHTARAHGMAVMLGCMVETSLGVAAAAHISSLADYADLDGPLLLADDPFVGLSYEGALINVCGGPGLGVEPGP